MIFLASFWDLVVESAPWLLAGYLLAGIIKQVIPDRWIKGQLARPGAGPVLKAAFIGAPLPLCSCGVIPAALGIRKAGASRGATSSFLVATPETGVDSISFSYAVLGPIFAVSRPVGAILSAIAAGLLVNAMHREDETAAADCCAAAQLKQAPQESEAADAAASACCASAQQRAKPLPLGERFVKAIAYGYGRMIADTAKWLVIGLAAAALVAVLVPQSFFLRWGDGLPAMIVMVIVGLPMYICATASTPVAAGFLFAGISPGAALVFLLTGPATNIATMGVIREQMGTRSLIAYLIGVIGTAIACGLLLNELYAWFGWPLQLSAMAHGESWSWWRHGLAVLLSALVLRVWIQPLFAQRGRLAESA